MSNEAPDNSPIVLAYSGGLDTSFCVPWLRETYKSPIITVTVDTGGLSADAARSLQTRSSTLGAQAHHLIDAKQEFFDQILQFLIIGNIRRGQLYPLCVGAERGLQAQKIAMAARKLGASRVAHGCTAAGNDQVRFEVALRTLNPDLEILAPVRDHAWAREDQLSFLAQRGLPRPSRGGQYSVNRGLWGVTIGGRETLGSKDPLPESEWVLSADAFSAPSPVERHTVVFQGGIPVGLDGQALEPVDLIETLENSAGPFGIGRGIHLGDTVLGTKGRVAFEAPAAEVLLTAHRELEKLTLGARQSRVKDTVAAIYGDLVHEGQHLDPVCRDIEALLLSSQSRVSGEVHLLFRPGSVFVEGVTSPHSLMAATRGVYGEAAGEWTAADAVGFSKLLALPGMLHTRAGNASSGPSGDEP